MSNKQASGIHIAISGKSGCGNTTVSRILAERLNLNLVNYTFRSIAEEDGISFGEVCRLAEKDYSYDRRVDENQVKLALQGPSVLGSRLAIWMLKEAHLKVFLAGSPEVRAERITRREGGSIREQMEITLKRDQRDHKRYVKLYGIDNNNYAFADLIINTDRLNAQQVAGIIEAAARGIME
ncbi:MAG: cytidylate kinase [Spirochaetales bacterium]|nr:MAG: cytidylate kinase [Spirochaetales bacterium]